jgi:hypothetical protein
MNKKQRQTQAKKWIATIIGREQNEGLIQEFGENEGLKIHAEVLEIAEKLQASARAEEKRLQAKIK